MSNEDRLGTIFELGPDGYGYVIDQQEPGRSYAFRVDQLSGMAEAEARCQLDGRAVRFSLAADGRTIQTITLARSAATTLRR